jgi:hypothetical protein
VQLNPISIGAVRVPVAAATDSNTVLENRAQRYRAAGSDPKDSRRLRPFNEAPVAQLEKCMRRSE